MTKSELLQWRRQQMDSAVMQAKAALDNWLWGNTTLAKTRNDVDEWLDYAQEVLDDLNRDNP